MPSTEKTVNTNRQETFNNIIYNNTLSKTHIETYENEEHLVVPMIMIKEGVLNSIYYPKNELSKFPQSWDGKPVTFYHPEEYRNNVSANKPHIQEKYKIGTIFNTQFLEDRLKSEAWINIKKANKIAPGLIERLQKNIPTDVSTGLFIEGEETQGVFNGKQYKLIGHNYRPDHLAILIKEEPAQSWNEGAGMPRINSEQDKSITSCIKNFINKVNPIINEQEPKENPMAEEKKTFTEEQKAEITNMISAAVTNAMKEAVETLKPVVEQKPEEKEEAPKINSIEDVYKVIPEAIKNDIEMGLKIHNSEKTKVVDSIMKLSTNKFTKEALEAKPLEELNMIKDIANVPSYEGRNNSKETKSEQVEKVPSLIEAINKRNNK